MLLDSQELRDNLVGVPHYFHIMISFAGHFVMELCMKHGEQLNITVHEPLQKVSAVLGHFVRIPTMPQHPFARITTGLIRRLSECTAGLGIEMMAQSPFERLSGQLTVACQSGTADQRGGLVAPNDAQASLPLPDELLYSDFGDFAFLDS